jgi:hypothetical protein
MTLVDAEWQAIDLEGYNGYLIEDILFTDVVLV